MPAMKYKDESFICDIKAGISSSFKPPHFFSLQNEQIIIIIDTISSHYYHQKIIRKMFSISSPSHSQSHSHGCIEKKWWLTNKKIVEMYIRDARSLISSQDQTNITSAITLLDSALTLSPKFEPAIELKATSLLHLRRFNEVASMLQDYIPSLKMSSTDDSFSSSSSSSSDRERVKLLNDDGDSSYRLERSVKCFSVLDLKKKVMAGFVKNRDREGQWRYLILGQACCHLGLMEDAMALLQTGKRLATAAFRRESVNLSDDSFTFFDEPQTYSPPTPESESINHLLSHIKLLLRRKTAAISAAEAGLYTEAIRHFSKIIDSRRGAPQSFLAECFILRASCYQSLGRLAEAIADCNRTLSLNPSSINALTTRAVLYETIYCLPDSLHDLEHLKLLYNSILRDRKLPGPTWKRQNILYSQIPGKLISLANKIQELKPKVASGDIGNVDYYALMGLRRGCSRSELERSHLLLSLRHKPDKSTVFIDRCEFTEESDIDSIKDRAKMSALMLYRMIQKGYTNLMRTVLDEEANEKQRKKASAALQQAMKLDEQQQQQQQQQSVKPVKIVTVTTKNRQQVETKNAFQGVFCRDLAAVGSLLSQTGFNRPITVKYEGLSC